ncbi:hypothetical protein FA10DRAFT_179234 [Acaromyces ingoldii]|uniref:Uncharacterized protein n=1 Tax=Acaromyces ingoldii TaxID=215250 RepID=A0A316YGY6_9BASI|nr:hypothetical protein FA10DRAFT_179234 [Acaromyces ingoldii]PWN87878.1 hypothetical protein FA10DRAFT_179234 [Acaromyces ingoldii]
MGRQARISSGDGDGKGEVKSRAASYVKKQQGPPVLSEPPRNAPLCNAASLCLLPDRSATGPISVLVLRLLRHCNYACASLCFLVTVTLSLCPPLRTLSVERRYQLPSRYVSPFAGCGDQRIDPCPLARWPAPLRMYVSGR